MKKVLNDIKAELPNFKDREVLKRFLFIVLIIFFSLTVLCEPMNIKSNYDSKVDSTSVVLYDHTFNKSYTLSKDVWDLNSRLKRCSDLLCEIDGIKYYIISNKIKL